MADGASGHPELLSEEVTFSSKEEMAYVGSIMPRIFHLSNITLIVSTLLKDLWGIVQHVVSEKATGRMKHGIMVLGPRGTGKTTSLLYVMKKLKENSDKHCSLLISSSCEKPVFLDYLKWFCDVNIKGERKDLLDDDKLVRYILSLRGTVFKDRKCFLLVDMGDLKGAEDKKILQLLQQIQIAVQMEWYVIVASTSGAGWQYRGSTPAGKQSKERILQLQINFHVIESNNFSLEETLAYIRTISAAKHGEEQSLWNKTLCETTNGNPLLLSYYYMACGDEKHISRGWQLVYVQLLNITENLIRVMNDKLYDDTLENCHTWLIHAMQEYPIPQNKMGHYTTSYVALEYLTFIAKEDDRFFFLKLVFPMLYETFVKKCVSCFKKPSYECLASSAIVQGLMFEQEFLHCDMLRELSVTTVSNGGSKKFTFNVSTMPDQCETALIQLSASCLHHLRPGHRAIDAVCLTSDTEGSTTEKYLLLVQVSLSSYVVHKSKALEIRDVVINPEKEHASVPDLSIAEFYRYMAKKGGDEVKPDHVVFIYASPVELKQPSDMDFVSELQERELRSRKVAAPEYRYGFVDRNSVAGNLLLQLQKEVKP